MSREQHPFPLGSSFCILVMHAYRHWWLLPVILNAYIVARNECSVLAGNPPKHCKPFPEKKPADPCSRNAMETAIHIAIMWADTRIPAT
jgi:hypothetical protein